jgi:hypothetical protein
MQSVQTSLVEAEEYLSDAEPYDAPPTLSKKRSQSTMESGDVDLLSAYIEKQCEEKSIRARLYRAIQHLDQRIDQREELIDELISDMSVGDLRKYVLSNSNIDDEEDVRGDVQEKP